MKKVESTYEHRGVTFRCTDEAIADALEFSGLYLLRHVELSIDSMINATARASNAPPLQPFNVSLKIDKEAPTDTEIHHVIRVFRTDH